MGRFIELKSLSVGHLISSKDIWECEKHAVMLRCLCKDFLESSVRHIFKTEKLEIRVVIKYFCNNGMLHKERISSDKARNLPKRDIRFILLK